MRGANVVRRRSVTNLGETAGSTGSVNGGQADGGGSGLLAGGSAAGEGPGVSGRRDAGSTGPQGAVGQAAATSGAQGGAVASPAPAPGAIRPLPARPRRPAATRSRFALTNWRVRWRLAAVIAVPTLTAAVLGALTINGDVNNWQATGRVQHLAQLNADTAKLSQALEDELNVSAAFAATRPNNAALAGPLRLAQNATDAAANAVANDSSGVTTGAGYQPGTVQDLNAVQASINDLANVRKGVTTSQFPASQIVRVYTGNLIGPANTFSAAIGNGANDANLQGNVTALGALLRLENQVSVQRAILYAALVSPQGTLRPEDLATLEQAEQQNYSNTVSGGPVDVASSNELLAEQLAANPSVPLSRSGQLNAVTWDHDMTVTLKDTRTVADQLASAVTGRANTLRSQATTNMLVTSLVTLLLLLQIG